MKTGRGNNRAVMAIIVRLPFCDRPVALPALAKLVVKGTNSASRLWLAQRMADRLAAALPGRRLHVVADSAYARAELGKLGKDVTWTTRLRKDAALHGLPPAPRPGKEGLTPRPRGPAAVPGQARRHRIPARSQLSLLLLLMGFLPPSDERMRATVLAIAGELTKDDLVLRYRVEGTDTGFSGDEGTFTICSFWLVSALAMIGETDRARALCQKLLSFAGPLLLYAEEIDTTTGEHLGNFPQAFTHLALIEAVSLLIASELAEDVKSAGWDPAASAQVRSG